MCLLYKQSAFKCKPFRFDNIVVSPIRLDLFYDFLRLFLYQNWPIDLFVLFSIYRLQFRRVRTKRHFFYLDLSVQFVFKLFRRTYRVHGTIQLNKRLVTISFWKNFGVYRFFIFISPFVSCQVRNSNKIRLESFKSAPNSHGFTTISVPELLLNRATEPSKYVYNSE